VAQLNAEWHRAHPMPPGASFEQRVAWHREHAEACGCRTPPPDIAEAIAKAGPPVEPAPDAPGSR
jgi:hypothetical protein